MKLRRGLIFITYIFVLVFVFANIIGVRAATKGETYYNDNGKANFTSKISEEVELGFGATYIHDKGTTNRSGVVYDQNLHILLQQSNVSNGTKVVTWGGYKQKHTVSTALSRMTLKELAKNYEANHPGWKVIGGINADQYCWGYGEEIHKGYDLLENRPYYPMKADGEYWFSNSFVGPNCANVVGFLNDGSTNALVYNDAPLNTQFKLTVYDENNNLLGKFDVNDMNPVTKVSGQYTYVYALTDTGNKQSPMNRMNESKEKTISSTNDLYIVSNADKTWVSNSVDYAWFKKASNSGAVAVNQFFGKGTIDQIDKSATITATQFAIETTNTQLLSLLKSGCYVIAQYEYYGGYENCESAIGFHSPQRVNNVDCYVGNYNDTNGYPRSVVGITEDGKVALITGNGTKNSGFTSHEINAACKAYNIKTAFQMDGGGSATMILRDESGEFVTANNPSDGSDRSIFNGIFFVVKDTVSEISTLNLTDSSFELDVNVIDYGTNLDVEKNYIQITGKKDGKPYEDTKEVVDGKVLFEGLDSNTEYTYTLKYKIKDSNVIEKTLSSGKVTTAKLMPVIKLLQLDVEDGNLTIRVLTTDPNQALLKRDMKISFDGGENYYSFDPSKIFVIEEFRGDPFTNIKILIKYNINDGSGNHEKEISDFDIEYTLFVFMDYLKNSFVNETLSCFTNDSE